MKPGTRNTGNALVFRGETNWPSYRYTAQTNGPRALLMLMATCRCFRCYACPGNVYFSAKTRAPPTHARSQLTGIQNRNQLKRFYASREVSLFHRCRNDVQPRSGPSICILLAAEYFQAFPARSDNPRTITPVYVCCQRDQTAGRRT